MKKILLAIGFLALFMVLAVGNTSSTQNEYLIYLTAANFEEMFKRNKGSRWFIMFFAPWCRPCKKALPDWREFAEAVNGKIKVAAVNCEDNPNLAEQFGIRGFPTFIYIQDGKLYQYSGPRTVEDWSQFAESIYQKTGANPTQGAV